MDKSTTICIHMVDGEKHVFEMPVRPNTGTDYTVASKVEKMLNQRSIALAIDNRLLIIPMEQIKTIEVSPLLVKLPEAVVPCVTPLRSTRFEPTASPARRIDSRVSQGV